MQLANLTLDEIPHTVWDLLIAGVEHARDSLHTPCIATVGDDGPTQRTVVLRHVDAAERIVVCHTDRRSAKAAELLREPRTSWHFYDRGRKLQLLLRGVSQLHTDGPLADACWQRSARHSKACYNTATPPGEPVSGPPPAPPAIGNEADAAHARRHFAAISCDVTAMEWLYLSSGGHRRAQFQWRSDRFVGRWVTP